jgi:small subunit ribosomal protein S6
MAKAPPIYDLMLLLSTGAPDELRAKILSDVEQAISSGGGSIERNDDWGTRTLAYQIEHQTDAEYHLLQFSGPPSLLEALSHSLKIADGVLRFRIIKVLPGTPEPPASGPPVANVPAAPPPVQVPVAVAAVPDDGEGDGEE